ncbi:PepSY-associated TM helix domain-containing protein [Roseibium litorale]|uniref:PepSY domain-containing protein n=1 Tax=Roseibium litorale TaxID=2803841 RepID=A0ABR9CND8_9HYPH|nr:PepSY domain-containing protein [Roseibium litorale]MBD8892403.1 PepSY domain-containing protein [Roseibium litorale]
MTDNSLPFDAASAATGKPAVYDRRFYLAAWRWHFYAGLFIIPFLLILSVTGMMMMYIGYFDGRDGENITVPVPASVSAMAVSRQAELAAEAIPGGTVVEWLSPKAVDRVAVFRVKAPDGVQTMVAIDPYTGGVVETWVRRNGWYDFADNIHSDLLLGTPGDRILEIAAGLGIVMLISGVYLWWPRGQRLRDCLVPAFGQSGRAFLKSLHTVIGIWVSFFLLLFLLSGMSWTGVWGTKLVQAWNTFPAEKWDNVPLSDETHASMNHGAMSDVPWALEQTLMPASGSQAGVVGIAPGTPVDIDSVSSLAKAAGFNARYRVAYPKGETGVWTINQDTMSADAEDPFSDRTVHVDRYTGRVLANVGFADYSLAGKTMAVSIPLHMGLTGLWNLALNTLVCLSVQFLCISGVLMWWTRRPSKAAPRFFAPQVPENRPHWRGAMVLMLAVSMAFPLAGLTLVTVLALDLLILSKVPVLRRVFA